MSSYTHFTLEERKCLQEELEKKSGVRAIARMLGRSPSSVSREIKRNFSKTTKRYHSWRAQILTIERRRKKRRSAIQPGTMAWDYIVEKLEMFWSPEAICGRWHMDHPEERPLNFSTIYRYIKEGLFPSIKAKTHLRRRGKRKYKRNANYNTIQPDRIIPEWPKPIRSRSRIGDWEGDTVYGGVGKGLLVTLVDRKSRFLRAGLLPSRDAVRTREVVEELLAGFPVRSVSFDNGAEFSEFRQLEEHLQAPIYFAEPHKPWQRGTNENTNGILRFFFPKGFDFRGLSPEQLQEAVDLINHRPRKCLNWKTPFEVFSSFGVALT